MSHFARAEIRCDGRTPFGRCRDYHAMDSHGHITKSDLVALRKGAAKLGWTRSHYKDNLFEKTPMDFCPSCSAAKMEGHKR